MTKLVDVIAPGGVFVAVDGQRVHIDTPLDLGVALELAKEQAGTWFPERGESEPTEKDS